MATCFGCSTFLAPETPATLRGGWLKPGGIISHKIDHSSHAITKSWNGHYAIPDPVWSLIVGGRPYLLNRMTPKQHREAIENVGFEILFKKFEMARETDTNSPCRSVKDREECQIKTSTFVCQKPLAEAAIGA